MSTVQLGLGIGTPAGVDCTVTSTATAGAGTAPQFTGTFGPGLFCVRVYDVGNLFAAPLSDLLPAALSALKGELDERNRRSPRECR